MKKYHWNIFGHGKQLSQLESDLSYANVSHAYLFAGVSGIGKFTVAKTLAKMLQCEVVAPGADAVIAPCSQCSTCIQLEKGYQLDTIELFDDGESIKIEKVREILNRLYMSTQSHFNILLLKNIERCTPESANALLKIIEDPPSSVVFLFTTSRLEALLKTLISRFRIYKFQHLPELELMNFLQSRCPKLNAEELKMIAQLAFGKPGVALQFAQNKELFGQFQNLYNRIGGFMKKPEEFAPQTRSMVDTLRSAPCVDVAESFAYIADRVKKELASQTRLIPGTLRSAACVNESSSQAFLDVTLMQLQKKLHQEIAQLRPSSELVKTIQLVKSVQQGYEMLGRNVNKRLLFENLMLSL